MRPVASPKTMKILFLHSTTDETAGGGAEVVVWSQMRGLRDAGHECSIAGTREGTGTARRELDGIETWAVGIRNLYAPDYGVQHSRLGRAAWHTLDSFNPLMQRGLADVVRRAAPDVVSIQSITGWSSAAWRTLSELGVPTVQILHGHEAICPRATMFRGGENCRSQCLDCRLLRLPHRALSRNVTAVVGASRYILDRHLDLGYFHGVPIRRVIHNVRSEAQVGVRGGEPSATTEKRTLRFGFIGRLHPSKGILELIEAFSFARLRDAELVIAGAGATDFEEVVRKRVGGVGTVRLLGRVEAHAFYRSVDVVVVPSLCHDVLPGVVLESLAFGLPVIGSERGGIPEMVEDGRNGLLFDPDAPGALAASLARFHGDAILRERLLAATKASSRPFTDFAAWIGAYGELYETVRQVYKGWGPGPVS